MKVLSVFGTRPEAIKMAPIVKELEKYPKDITSRICVTAQHRQMLDQVLTIFNIVPDYDLNIMQEGQSPIHVAAAILNNIEPILKTEQPDWVLVQGDTTTVAATSFAAFYAGAKVGHVEAGLRTFNKYHPFPEEVNRRIAGVIADLHFAPTQNAKENLLREGIAEDTIHVTGNSVIDALRMAVNMPFQLSSFLKHISDSARVILVTSHRRENFGVPLENICHAIESIAHAYAEDVHIVYPVHLNPNVRETVYQILGNIPNVTLTAPLDYLPMIHLMKRATLVLTDSGGIQEEAPGLGKPVLVLRETTERPEAVEAGSVRIVGTDFAKIVEWTRRLLDDPNEYGKMAQTINPYGDGRAAQRIIHLLLDKKIHEKQLRSENITST